MTTKTKRAEKKRVEPELESMSEEMKMAHLGGYLEDLKHLRAHRDGMLASFQEDVAGRKQEYASAAAFRTGHLEESRRQNTALERIAAALERGRASAAPAQACGAVSPDEKATCAKPGGHGGRHSWNGEGSGG